MAECATELGGDRAAHVTRLRGCSTEALEHAYTQLDALINAIRAEQLQILAELDQRDVGRHDGCANTADWVAMTSRVHTATARTRVHTAQRLRELPAISAAAAQGLLSWDQLVGLTKIATQESDQQWATDGPGFAPATLDAIARGRRHISTRDARTRHRRRALYWWTDDRLGMVRLSGRLPEVEGQTVITALQRLAERFGPDTDGSWAPGHQRHADALVELASAALADDADHDRACVVLHVPADAAAVIADKT